MSEMTKILLKKKIQTQKVRKEENPDRRFFTMIIFIIKIKSERQILNGY